MKENLANYVVPDTGCSMRKAALPFDTMQPEAAAIRSRVRNLFHTRSEQRRIDTFRLLQTDHSDRNVALTTVLTTLKDLNFDRVEPILDSVDSGLHGDAGEKRAQLLKNIFGSTDSKYFEEARAEMKVDEESLVHLLHHKSLYPLIGAMLEDTKTYSMPLGFLFSLVKLDDYPQSVRGNFSPMQVDNQFSLSPYPDGWYLCGELEKYFDEAKNLNATTAVKEEGTTLFLVLFSPKIAALCTTDFESNGKAYFAGNLYCPLDDDSRARLLVANATDKGNVTLGATQWAFMRTFDESLSHTSVDEHITYAASLPDVFENHTFEYTYFDQGKQRTSQVTRHRYWLLNKEGSDDDKLVSRYNLQ